jgi:hypothetical protein
MEDGSTDRAELSYNQEVFLVIEGEGENAQMLTEDGNLVVFESLWHAGPLVHELQGLGMMASIVPMVIWTLYTLTDSLDLGLWVVRHDGAVTSIEEIVFP